MATISAPLIGIPACARSMDGHPFNVVGEKYIAAAQAAGGLPLLIPSLPEPLAPDAVLDALDALLITGSPSNVHPARYQGEASRPGTMHDEQRDATTLPLIRAAIARGMPVLAICRGHQELNVTLGGTLFQHVHEIPGRLDHRAPEGKSIPEQYAPAHKVSVTPGGRLEHLVGEREFMVNSLHGQAIDRLAPGLRVEAVAPDGTIEAVSAPDAPGFLLSVQWHPEWRALENPVSMRLLGAF
ncbi:MAG: gamma-glutamyl-gamma-aminobutyrate hydrolase family protein, partial [Zavarzinia sp.]|nr:gamma-glutamyl-gamma-aminobutyrate hydrolase family protein [Zavarzinia sp.]